MRCREPRIQRDRLKKMVTSFVEPILSELPPVMATSHIRLVGIWMRKGRTRKTLAFVGCQFDLDLLRDRTRHITVHRQDVVERTLVMLCPDMSVCCRMNQLGGDAHTIACADHRALNHAIDVQVSRDLL